MDHHIETFEFVPLATSCVRDVVVVVVLHDSSLASPFLDLSELLDFEINVQIIHAIEESIEESVSSPSSALACLLALPHVVDLLSWAFQHC
jgi:hypothetical protein